MLLVLFAVVNLYACLAAFIVAAGLGVFGYLSRAEKPKSAEPPPSPGPRSETRPPPPEQPRPARPESNARPSPGPAVRRTTKRIADQPFRVRAELVYLMGNGSDRTQGGFRVDVCGDIAVGAETTVDLIITLEDLGEGRVWPVYATQARRRDDQTGQFVLRSTLGKVSPPGRPDSGWTSVGVVSFEDFTAPKAGHRSFRLSCLAVPSGLSQSSLVDDRLRGGLLAATSTTLGVNLVRRGYVEERRDRTKAAGLVLCLAYVFAERGCGDRRRAEAASRRWMEAQLALGSPAHPDAVGFTRATMEAALGLARESVVEPKLLARQLLACGHPDLACDALRLCVEIAKEGEILAAGALAELKQLGQEMGLGPADLRAALDEISPAPEAAADREQAALIGLDLTWDRARIRRHLLAQFMQWNSRHPRNAGERETITRRLEAIARLRQRYL